MAASRDSASCGRTSAARGNSGSWVEIVMASPPRVLRTPGTRAACPGHGSTSARYYDNDPDWVVERKALEEALKAQKEGKVRFLGFTGHKSPHIHLKMLGVHKWDTVQMPV